MTQQYIYKTENFEGPLDILLSLIEKRKLLINQVSLSVITEDFIHFIKDLDTENEFYLKHKTQFLSIASVLLLIKSKSLLPNLETTTEENVEIEDLERRLKILTLMREYGQKIDALFNKKNLYFQGNFKRDIVLFTPTKDINFDNIKEGIYKVLSKIPKIEKEIEKVKIKKSISIEEMMDTLSDRIKGAFNMKFTTFSGASRKRFENEEEFREHKRHIALSFLALLELIKQNMILANQNELFEEIDLQSTKVNTPTYNNI
ncbi:segregation/condensation protein A [Candidatus Parcubacteria bacterium]|nr:segregation/condensation protein A [Candidatus Parcubacteria bacterium]